MLQIVSDMIPNMNWKFHENPFIPFLVMLLTGTNAPWKNRGKSSVQGLNVTFPKSSRLFPVPCLTSPENFP